jgi:hypothetical protein
MGWEKFSCQLKWEENTSPSSAYNVIILRDEMECKGKSLITDIDLRYIRYFLLVESLSMSMHLHIGTDTDVVSYL